jgi:hypothetical protein
MKTDGGTTEAAVAASLAGARLIRWALTAALAVFAALCLGELAISLASWVVGSNGHWRELSTRHALSVGGVLMVLLMATFATMARTGGLVRAAAVMVVGGIFLIGLSNVPTTLGGMQPSCVVVHWNQTAFTGDVLHAIGADAADAASMDLLYSDDHWHHFRLTDGRHLEVPRERVVALETCPEQQ